jgi:hypothetical protein
MFVPKGRTLEFLVLDCVLSATASVDEFVAARSSKNN